MDNAHYVGKGIRLPLNRLSLTCVALYIVMLIAFPSNSLTSLMYYAAVGICAMAMIAGSKTLTINKYIYAMVLLGALMLLSYPFSQTEEQIKSYYMESYWRSLLLAFFVINNMKKKEDIHFLTIATLIGATLLAINVYRVYGLENLIFSDIRMDDTITNQNRMGVHCAFAIAFAIERMVSDKKRRLIYLACMIVILPAVLFTGSRKAILILGAAIITLAFASMTKKRAISALKILMIAAVAIIAIVLIIFFVPAFEIIKERFIDLFNIFDSEGEGSGSDSLRITLIRDGLAAFARSPFFGNGFCHSYYELGYYAHNNLVELLMNHGAIGAVLYYIPYIIIIKGALKYRRRNMTYAALLLMIMVGVIVCEIGVVTYYDRHLTPLIASCFMGAILANRETEEDTSNVG